MTTQPVEEPHKPEYFLQMLEQFGPMTNNILFASDYPHWDADDPDFALPNNMPDEMKAKIHYDNGAKVYGL